MLTVISLRHLPIAYRCISKQIIGHELGPKIFRSFLSASTQCKPISRPYSQRWLHVTEANKDVVPFKLSDIGEGIREVVIKEWFVKAGDHVRQFDPICEVQSDKATVTITSRYDGVVRSLHFEPQDVCLVGQALVDIEVEGSPSEVINKETSSTSQPSSMSSSDLSEVSELEEKPLATPSVRRIAAENKINLSDVVGTGKGGRILKEDVLNFIHGEPSSQVGAAASSSTPKSLPPQPKVTLQSEDKRVPLTVIQKAMKASMTLANQIPHFVLSEELDVSQLVELRSRTAKLLMDQHGVKLTFMPFFIKATSLALRQFPMLNAHTDENCDSLIYKAAHNIGIAVDTPEGLLVPNIKSVESLSILEISNELKRLQDLGIRGKLGTNELSGGTITLSNIGSIGGTYTSPCILPPQVLIAGIGRIRKLPRFDDDGSIRVGNILNVSWAADHRVVDGATVTRFCHLWRSYLETPSSMIFDLK